VVTGMYEPTVDAYAANVYLEKALNRIGRERLVWRYTPTLFALHSKEQKSMNFDTNARYLESHEWARKDGDLVVCGVSDYAQDSLGDIVFVELPEVGATFTKGDAFGVVESVKAASDVYMPVGGEIVEINGDLEDSPETVNSDPFGTGWLIKVKPSNADDLESLLSVDDYKKFTEGLDA
jgi:glycine cleavage system H protein